MPLVRCQAHGRVYDSAKEAGCPLCLQEGPAGMRARARASKEKEEAAQQSAVSSRTMLFLAVLALALAGGGGYWMWYRSSGNPQARAQAVRDSLRALAAGPAAPDTTKFAAPDDYTPIRRARQLRNTLAEMLQANRSTILGMAEGPIDTSVTERTPRRRAQQYLRFTTRWQERLATLTAGGTDFRYAPGVRLGPQMDQVSNFLGAASSVMKDLAPIDRVKPYAERESDIIAARGYLNSAGTVLTSLPR